jgi:hypothetical protein
MGKECKYPIGSHVYYKSVVECHTFGNGPVFWKQPAERHGRVVQFHPENKKQYEILPDGELYKTERVAERNILEYVDDMNEFWVKHVKNKSIDYSWFCHDSQFDIERFGLLSDKQLFCELTELKDLVKFLLAERMKDGK